MGFDLNIVRDSLTGVDGSDVDVIGIEGNFESKFRLNFMFRTAKVFGANILDYSINAGREELSGEYVSSFPRKGTLTVRRLSKGQKIERGFLKKLTSADGETYLGISIAPGGVTSYGKRWIRSLQTAEVSKLSQNREKRDGNGFHITIVSPPEYETLSEEQLKKLDHGEITYVKTGLGRRIQSDAQTYYITVLSTHGDYIRKSLGLPKKDLHITLGFDPHDIHDIPKDETTWYPV